MIIVFILFLCLLLYGAAEYRCHRNNIDKIPNAYDTIDALLGKIKKVSRDLNTNVTSIDEEIARQVYYNTFPEIKISTDTIL